MGWNLPEQVRLQALSGCNQPTGSSSRSGRNRGAAAEGHAIGELQLKRMQSGSSSRKVHAIGELLNFGDEQPKRTQASGEQQLKRTEMGNLKAVTKYRCNRGAAAEADAIGEQQLCTELSSAGSLSRSYL